MSNSKINAERIHQAFQGKNKEETILDIVITNDLNQRLEIANTYEELYKTSLYEDIKSKLKGDFKELSGYLFLSPQEFSAKMLKRGFKGFSIDEEIIFEILSAHTLEEYILIGEAYKNETNKELKKDLEKNFSGSLKRNILKLISTQRRINNNPDLKLCEQLADELIKEDIKKWVDNENLFQKVFIECSHEEMVLIGRFYFQKTGQSLIDDIEKKLNGKNKTFLREILYNNIIPHELYAEKINKSIKGLGTNTALLNRCLSSRCGLDMPQIKEIYKWKYKTSLKQDIIGDCSGIYQKLCLYVAEC
jgi:hypothetical protein